MITESSFRTCMSSKYRKDDREILIHVRTRWYCYQTCSLFSKDGLPLSLAIVSLALSLVALISVLWPENWSTFVLWNLLAETLFSKRTSSSAYVRSLHSGNMKNMKTPRTIVRPAKKNPVLPAQFQSVGDSIRGTMMLLMIPPLRWY